VIAGSAWLWTLSSALAGPLVMPEELVQYAHKLDCDQVEDFFQGRSMINPPYAYGYLSGDRRDSAVFWCQKTIGDQRQFYLIIMLQDGGHELAKCPRRIKWRNYPGGLEIFQDPRMSLDRFHYMDDSNRKVPQGVKATHNAIRSAAGGTQEIFYCYRGEWLVRMLH
jgi:hypothetical protein